jgi:uncharacterized protein with von Willebrand factor type A (vWA) domain
MTAAGVETTLLGFARALRAAGVAVTQDRSQVFLAAVARVGLEDQQRTYWAGRATLCSCPEDLAVYDKVFWAWFADDGSTLTAQRPMQPAPPQKQAPLGEEDAEGGDGGPGDDLVVRVAASDVEVLRHRDIASLSQGERARLGRMFARLSPRAPTRTSYRRRAARRGTLDTDATLRQMLTHLGEPVELRYRHRSRRDRRVVLVVDVSGSMGPYADSLLRLAHRVTRAMPTETFSVGTRVTRLTRAMRQRDPDKALVAAGEVVPDWSGGTRLGEGLQVFLRRWGQRGMVRGAVVVVFSDGWERGDASLLAEQMRRLHLLAHRVVWVNPHKGSAGYQPVQAGMAAALPYVDDFVAGHSLAAFERVLEVIADA